MKTTTKIIFAVAIIITAIALLFRRHGTSGKDECTARYYRDHRAQFRQLVDTLRALHTRYPGYEPVLIGHRGNSSNVILRFSFAHDHGEATMFYNFLYSTDNTDSCTGYIEKDAHFTDSTGNEHYDDSCSSWTAAEKSTAAAFIRDSCLWHTFSLIRRSEAEIVRIEKDGFVISLEGPAVIEHGGGQYSFMYIPFAKSSVPDSEMIITATIDSDVYLYRTRRD